MKKLISLVTFFTASMALSPDGKCRILALRGGGVHGSFEVGALKALVENLPASEVHYDYVSGVSVGAINASYFAIYDFGKEKEAVAKMEEMYIQNEDNFEFWPTVIFEPFWKDSIISPEKLLHKLERELNGNPYKRKVSIQSVDINTGKVIIFDETVPEPLRAKVVLSSASIPSFFPPVKIDDWLLVDGGTF
jgi:NTE family protein